MRRLVSRNPSSRSFLVRKRIIIGALASLPILIFLSLWASVPWVWSPVDDAGHALGLRDLVGQFGYVGGMGAHINGMFESDLSWGLFRPSYWVYPSLIYLLDPTSAHIVRVLLALVAIGGPLAYFYRNGLRGPSFGFASILLVAAGSALYVGLFLVSLQELSGAAFIGLGLLLRSRWMRWLSWLIAAWFKAPFAWILIGQAVIDWRQGRRLLSIVNGGSGVLTLAVAGLMSRSGTYTSSYALDPDRMWFNLQNLLEPQVVLLPLLLLWWLAVTEQRLSWSPETVVFGVAWAGYTTQLLPWGVTAYYSGPISYLLGLLLISSLCRKSLPPPGPARTLVGLAVPTVLGTVLVSNSLVLGLNINTAMVTLQGCLKDRPGSSAILQGNILYLTTSEEGPMRLGQNIQLEDPEWTGTIALGSMAPQDSLPTGIDLLLNAGPPLVPVPDSLVLVCGNDSAQVYSEY